MREQQSKIEWLNEPITETLIILSRFLGWINEKTGEPIYRRAYIEHHPRAYWDSTDVYTISIHCQANAHGDYYLHISRSGTSDEWHCFLVNGKWSETFIHLRHIKLFSELQEIIWAITRCNLFPSEYAMNEYCKPYRKD